MHLQTLQLAHALVQALSRSWMNHPAGPHTQHSLPEQSVPLSAPPLFIQEPLEQSLLMDCVLLLFGSFGSQVLLASLCLYWQTSCTVLVLLAHCWPLVAPTVPRSSLGPAGVQVSSSGRKQRLYSLYCLGWGEESPLCFLSVHTVECF